MNEEPAPRLAPVDMDPVSSSKCRSSRLFSGARALKRPMTLVFRSCSRTKSGVLEKTDMSPGGQRIPSGGKLRVNFISSQSTHIKYINSSHTSQGFLWGTKSKTATIVCFFP